MVGFGIFGVVVFPTAACDNRPRIGHSLGDYRRRGIHHNLQPRLLVIYGLKGAIPVAAGVVPAIYGAAWPATIMPSATTVVGEVFGAILVGMVIGGVWSFSALLIEHRRSQKPTPNM